MIKLTSQDDKYFIFAASKLVKNFEIYNPFNKGQWQRNFSDKVTVTYEPYIPPVISNGPPGSVPTLNQN
jgi:hypothetical protein